MRLAAIVVLIAFAGCVPLTADGVRQQGTLFVYTSAQEPERVIRCISRNAGERSIGGSGIERRGNAPGSQEVTIRDSVGVLAVALATRRDIFTDIEVRIQPASGLNHEALAKTLMKGC